MILCSHCSKPYPLKRYLLLGNPFTLRCPYCQVLLRGGRTTRQICVWALLAILLAAVLGILSERVLRFTSGTVLFAVVIASATIGAIAGLFIWRRGDFIHET